MISTWNKKIFHLKPERFLSIISECYPCSCGCPAPGVTLETNLCFFSRSRTKKAFPTRGRTPGRGLFTVRRRCKRAVSAAVAHPVLSKKCDNIASESGASAKHTEFYSFLYQYLFLTKRILLN